MNRHRLVTGSDLWPSATITIGDSAQLGEVFFGFTQDDPIGDEPLELITGMTYGQALILADALRNAAHTAAERSAARGPTGAKT